MGMKSVLTVLMLLNVITYTFNRLENSPSCPPTQIVDVPNNDGKAFSLCPKGCSTTFICHGPQTFYLFVTERDGSSVSFENPGNVTFDFSGNYPSVTMYHHFSNDGRKIVCQIGSAVPVNYTVQVEVSDCHDTTTIGIEDRNTSLNRSDSESVPDGKSCVSAECLTIGLTNGVTNAVAVGVTVVVLALLFVVIIGILLAIVALVYFQPHRIPSFFQGHTKPSSVVSTTPPDRSRETGNVKSMKLSDVGKETKKDLETSACVVSSFSPVVYRSTQPHSNLRTLDATNPTVLNIEIAPDDDNGMLACFTDSFTEGNEHLILEDSFQHVISVKPKGIQTTPDGEIPHYVHH